MRVVIAAAGTAGHINPGIAIANKIKREEKGSKIIFIGTTRGLENDLVPRAGYELKTINAYGLSKKISIENINAVRYDATYHIVTIIGQGELLSYDDYPSKRLNHQNSQRRFYSNSPYSILTAFNEEEKAVTLLCSMAKNQ